MATSPKQQLTAEQFATWAEKQPEGQRYELADGEIVAMAPERAQHALVKAEIFYRFRQAVERHGVSCTVFTDGMAVRIDAHTVFEPDVALRCGRPLPGAVVVYDDPMVIVEVTSPSTASIDSGSKLEGYFRLASLRHYLIVGTSRPTVIHHERLADGTIQTRILASGELRLDPPGLALDVASLFPDPAHMG